MGENAETQTFTSHDYGMQDPSFLQYRLDPRSLIDQIDITISGKKKSYLQDENGKVVVKEEKVGDQLVNDKGRTQIINWVTGIINSQTVQGNLDEDGYYNYLAEVRESIADIVMINLYNWDVKEVNYNYLIDSIMNSIQLFVSRTLENKERESYAGTFRHRDGGAEQQTKKFGF